MSLETILVVEDEEDIAELIRHTLAQESFRVLLVASGEEALAILEKQQPHLALLDLMLPGMGGFELCRRIRSQAATANLPVLILSAKGEEADVVTGLEAGADDYLTKPFSAKVLIARIRALLRRHFKPLRQDASGLLVIHDLTIDPARHQAFIQQQPLSLTLTEFKILLLLAKRPGWVMTRQQIVDGVRGEEYAVTERSVDVQIVGLRKKMGAAGKYVETVRGVGYRFKEFG